MVAGAALLVVLRDGLVAINVNAYYQSMVVGVVLLVAVVVDRLRVRRLERAGGHFAKSFVPEPADSDVDTERAPSPSTLDAT